MENVCVRFAPSPTGGLHIGGVRTALFNYLFAKKYNGRFILRIEDTDRARYVKGAEHYIIDALREYGIIPDEGPHTAGEHGPYQQSKRKDIYRQYADQLVATDKAYYAFDTPEELEAMHKRLTASRVIKPQYNTITRSTMKNSLTLPKEEVHASIADGIPYVIRLKVPREEDIRFKDMVRGWVKVNSEDIDDKVLVKSDGMPTYHLANVVDDHLMGITHVIRGEEWLPSAPLHVLLYEFLGWKEKMPKFAHLPLILRPDGNGKLSKRDADKAGFPIFPLNWKDPKTKELSIGFKEAGFLPEAMINFLALLGWNPGTDQELFSIEALIQAFSIERINKAGTQFNYDKAKWFNQQYIKLSPTSAFVPTFIKDLADNHQIQCRREMAEKIITLFKERVSFPHEFVSKIIILFRNPTSFDSNIKVKKWHMEAEKAMTLYVNELKKRKEMTAEDAKNLFWETLTAHGYKPGKHMQILRFLLTGQGSGPDLMSLIEIMGPQATANRIQSSIYLLNEKKR